MRRKSTTRGSYIPLAISLILIVLGIWALIKETPTAKLTSPIKTKSLQYPSTNDKSFPKQSEESETNLEVISTLTPPPEIIEGQTFKVAKIIDGDTIQLSNGQVVRYIGIDAPEVKDCFAKESTEKNIELILEKDVALEKDVSEVDKYGRILRYVYVGETFINELLIREGFAKAYPYPPDVKYRDLFNEAQTEARESNRGLWGTCTGQQLAQRQSSGQKSDTSGEDKDCSDFKTQNEAQAFFTSQGGPDKDPHKLDQDRDGQACESLPK